jgi:hypothetical protein
MKLTELEPRWIHPNVFVFLCPHCRKIFLTCKNVSMSSQEQYDLFEKEFGEDWNMLVVPSNPAVSWSISGSVPTDTKAAFVTDLTVAPSIDASASGHWHGRITNGECQP